VRLYQGAGKMQWCRLYQFKRWYSQAGTPRLAVEGRYDAAASTFPPAVPQSWPPTPGQSEKKAQVDSGCDMALPECSGVEMPLAHWLKKPSASTEPRAWRLPEAEQMFHLHRVTGAAIAVIRCAAFPRQ